jgi:hypothetical protein
MKLTREQMLMINGAIGEYRLSSTEKNLWTSEDEKNFTDIVNQLRVDYKKAGKGVKNVRAKASAGRSN